MSGSIDVNLGITYKYVPPIEVYGHEICYGVDEGQWEALCVLCGDREQGSTTDIKDAHLPHFWFYVFGKFDECSSSIDSLEEVVKESVDLSKHLGKKSTLSNKRAIKEDVYASAPDHLEDFIVVNVP